MSGCTFSILTKIREISKVISSAYADKVRGIISESDFINMKQLYDEDIQTYHTRKEHLEKELHQIYTRNKSMKNIADLLCKYTDFKTLTHEIVNDFIDNIQVGERTENNK